MIWTWWRDSKGRAEPFTRQSCRDPQESPTHSRRVQPPDASPLRASPPCGPSTTPVEGSARRYKPHPLEKSKKWIPPGWVFNPGDYSCSRLDWYKILDEVRSSEARVPKSRVLHFTHIIAFQLILDYETEMVRKLVMILFLSLTNSVNNPKLNSNIYVRLEIVLFFTPFWEWIQILFGNDYP